MTAEQWGVVLTGVGVGIAMLIFWLQRRPKHLDYAVLVNHRLLGESRLEKHESIRLMWVEDDGLDPAPMDHGRIVVLRVANNGKRPIRSEDFEIPLRIAIGHRGDTPVVWNYEVTSQYPDELNVEIDLASEEVEEVPHIIEVAPLLLNPGDWFEAELVANSPSAHIDVSGRVVGVTEIRDHGERTKHRDRILGGVLGGLLAVTGGAGFIVDPLEGLTQAAFSAFAGGLAGATALLFLYVRQRRRSPFGG